MKTEETNTIDILSEDFPIPDYNADLEETIEQAVNYYQTMPLNRRLTVAYRRKVNELIDIYNDRRGMRIYSHI